MRIWIDWLRLIAGLMAGAVLGGVLGTGMDVSSSATSMLGTTVALSVGFGSTVLLRAWYPRQELPSAAGTAALLLLLCSYLAVAPVVWEDLGPRDMGSFAVAGAVLFWLVFTSVAEQAVFAAFVIGGLAGAFCGVVGPVLVPGPFQLLLSEVLGRGQVSLVYSAFGLLGAFSGAFAAVAGRLSAWGLEEQEEHVWKFDEEGRLETPESH